MSTYETIVVEREDRVAVIRLNRPPVNALNGQLMREVVAAAKELDADNGVGCIIITGNEKAFAAGADIKEMQNKTYQDVSIDGLFDEWDEFAALRTPRIAAVAGFALGGGCEVAMMCDFIIAADNAKFGQPEIKLGVIPGIGGTQRLTRAIGKAKAMDLTLTGRFIGAEEAERSGLVSRVVPLDQLMTEAMDAAKTIANMSLPVAYAAREAVDVAFESTLAEGVRFERRLFTGLFALEDQTEGMTAFVEKRDPEFKHR